MSILEWILGRVLDPSLGGWGGAARCVQEMGWESLKEQYKQTKEQRTKTIDNIQGPQTRQHVLRGTVADIYEGVPKISWLVC